MRTVATNLAVRLSDVETRQLLRDARIGEEAKGKYFKVGSLVVDETGEFIASIRSFIMIESDIPIIVTAHYKTTTQEFECNNLFLLYGEIGKVWVRAPDNSRRARVNYYISTDDEETSGYIDAYLNVDNLASVKSRIRLKYLPTLTAEPQEGLPVKHELLTFGIAKEAAGVPAKIYSGYKRDVVVHYE